MFECNTPSKRRKRMEGHHDKHNEHDDARRGRARKGEERLGKARMEANDWVRARWRPNPKGRWDVRERKKSWKRARCG